MSGMVKRRHPWRRFLLVGGLLLAGAALTATLAAALQVHRIHVEGPRRFPISEVEETLRSSLGSMTLTVRAADLRNALLDLPWVDDATVRVTLDGTVFCLVRERQPVAVAHDSGVVRLLDARGRVLGVARGAIPELTLVDFGPYPEERATLLGAVVKLEGAWGATLRRATRLGPRDVALEFADLTCPVVMDPDLPAQLALARRVLAAWQASESPTPRRLDARVAGRIAVLPAIEPAPETS